MGGCLLLRQSAVVKFLDIRTGTERPIAGTCNNEGSSVRIGRRLLALPIWPTILKLSAFELQVCSA